MIEDKLRTFIAIELDQEVLKQIDQYTNSFRKKYPAGFRWVKAENLHLTLKFLGDTGVSKIQEISQKLENTCQAVKPFTLQLSGTGAFPSWQRPRSIWIGMDASVDLQILYHKIDDALGRIGIPSDGKKFSPHLTVCRISDHADPRFVDRLVKDIQNTQPPDSIAWEIHAIMFFKSRLQPDGPVYTPISKHCFSQILRV